ncbi:GGDEF domain-containing protein [Parathalassolituus penaei]|uniref:diguanylate cyclase n=1 Tax=Parathalassolituus penaei TaxID=2997323 RepID=A0A9X3IUX7_9GAMM|nr:GGDEF domain-containing protein [Parathalassolituus penaei]MCY0966653.1 GGDEF domain-containing protein [Parathalassolituus penaei]
MNHRPVDNSAAIPDPRQELVRVMYSQMPVVAAGNLALSMANILAYIERLPLTGLALFGAAVLVLTTMRIAAFGYYRLSRFRSWDAASHSRLLAFFSFLNGILWSSWGLFVVSSVPHADTLIMLVIQAGICAGTVSTSSASRVSLALFVVPVLTSLALWEGWQGTVDGNILAAVMLLYLVLILSSSQRIYRTLHGSIVLAHKNRLLADELYLHSNTDGLTGIANRRFFDNALQVACEASHQNGKSLSVMLVDVDFFKLYNDSKGHLEGDECLKIIASRLQTFFSSEEWFVARYGGEEFVVVLPGVDESRAYALAEEFRIEIANSRIPHDLALPWHHLTVSIGVASCLPRTEVFPQRLLEAADRALYTAKHSGRNRVNLASDMASMINGFALADLDLSAQL